MHFKKVETDFFNNQCIIFLVGKLVAAVEATVGSIENTLYRYKTTLCLFESGATIL